MSREHKKVFVAMSGGVDSSVAAFLLQKEGYDVAGVFMRCFNLDGCAERDAEDARRVAEHLGIPFYVFDFEEDYKREVVNYMIAGYRRGITPNPDVMCNKEIKFGLFLKKALKLGADYIATGHYVRLVSSNTNTKEKNIPNTIYYILHTARDSAKDQSYFLWTLTQEQLRHCLFPIGDYLKSEVRAIAKKAGLPTANKKDSQGICFLGKVSLRDFLREHIPPRRGAVLTVAGKEVGYHDGVHFYTIGQRRIGVGGLFAPYYVAAKDVSTNTLFVAPGRENPALYKKEIELADLNFIDPRRAADCINGGSVLARVRYRQPLAPAKLVISNLPSTKDKIANGRLIFSEPVKFVAPGQSAVFYNVSGEMLGGGVIK